MKRVLIIIGSIVVGIIAFIAVIFLITSITSKKLVCESKEGNITLMYNNKTITAYTAKGITYDLDGQKKLAEQMGIDAYLDEFSLWFSNNTTGTCTR